MAAMKLIALSGAGVLLLLLAALIGKYLGTLVLEIGWVFGVLGVLFAGDEAVLRAQQGGGNGGPNLVIAPGHGKVDTIDTTTEAEFMGGECRRISIFLSVFDVHVQNAPVTGRIAFFKHSPGQYLNAMRADCAQFNEIVLLGIESVDPLGQKVGVRLIAGLIARRIVPFIAQNDPVLRGERISLIQFGSRVDVYLPLNTKVKVQLGDRVAGGLTVLAAFA